MEMVNHEGHSGSCRVVRRFRSPWLSDLATEIEKDLRDAFAPHEAELKIQPIRISHLTEVGEGVQLTLVPHDPKRWTWWGDFESDLEVFRRRRLSKAWTELIGPDEVSKWARSKARDYLARLQDPSTQ